MNKPSLFQRAKIMKEVFLGRSHGPTIGGYLKLAKHIQRQEKAKYRNSSSFDGGSTGRHRDDWSYETDLPYNELSDSAEKMRARSRRLYNSDDTYKAAINTVVTNCIGTGLRPKPKVLGPDGKPDKVINKAIEDNFWRYSHKDQWDSRKKISFVGGGQRLALKTVLIAGDFVLNAVPSRRGALLPWMWQQVDVDRLDTSYDYLERALWNSEPAKQTVHGISLDEYGAPISYRFKGVTAPVPAKYIIHSYFSEDRPEQYAGVPAACAALAASYDKHELLENYATKSRAIADILFFLSNKNDDFPNAEDKDADEILGLSNMSVMRGEEAPEDIRFPDNVNDTIKPIIRMLQHGVCSCLGTSYTTVTRDMEGVNFAASKFIDIQEWRFYNMLKDWFIVDVCEPFYDRTVLQMVLAGRIPGVSPALYIADQYRYNACDWTGNGKYDVDPLKDMNSDNEGLRTGVLTLTDVVGKRGRDIDDHIALMKEEREKLKENGLEDIVKSWSNNSAKPEAAIDPNQDPETPEQELKNETGVTK